MIKKGITLLVFLCFWGRALFAQNANFNVAFPVVPGLGAWAYSVQNVPGGYFVYGNTKDSLNNQNPGLAKVDSIGNVIWSKSYHFTGYEFIENSVENEIGINVPWGGEIGTGSLYDTSGFYSWALFRFDTKGDTIWTKIYKDSISMTVNQIKITREKQCLIYGDWFHYFSMYYISNTLVLIKTDTTGNKIWKKTYHAPMGHVQIASGIDTCGDGGYILCAYDFDSIENYSKTACWGGQIMMIKTDSSGNTQWIKYIPNPLCNVRGFSIKSLKNGGYAICGLWDDSLSSHGDIAWSEMFMAKLNDTGSVVWTNTYGIKMPFESCALLSIKDLPNGDLISCGQGDTLLIGSVLKTDSNGNQKWLRYYDKFPPRDEPYLMDIQLTSDGGFISSGATTGNPSDFWVVKTDSLGCDTIGCNFTGIEQVKENDAGVKVFPNPSTGQFNLSLSNVSDKCSVEVYNVLGEKVYSTPSLLPQSGGGVSVSYLINLGAEPNGIYLYRVITENGGLVGEGKLIIQK